VAVVLDADPEAVERMGRIVLAPAPAAGRQARLDLADIQSRLRATGVNLAQTEFRGASIVMVSTAGASSTGPAYSISPHALQQQRDRAGNLLADLIRKSLAARNADLGGVSIAVQVDDKDLPVLLPALAGGACEIQGGDPRSMEEQALAVRYRDQRGQVGEVAIRCRMSPQPRILAARYTIPAGHILREVDVVWRQAPTSDGVVTRLEDALNRETRRMIRQDEPVRSADIQDVPLIRANDMVTVISRRGRVTITGVMKSRDTGSLGETVTLASLTGRNIVLARVTGLHEAEVITADEPPSDSLQDTTGRIEFRRGSQP